MHSITSLIFFLLLDWQLGDTRQIEAYLIGSYYFSLISSIKLFIGLNDSAWWVNVNYELYFVFLFGMADNYYWKSSSF